MMTPNLGPPVRALYIISGIALVALPWVVTIEGWLRWVVLVMGLLALIEGAIGW